jgi:hypothetical protein
MISHFALIFLCICVFTRCFHVSLLEPYKSNSISGHVSTSPPPVKVSNGSEYEVATILDSKLIRNKLYYLVDWLGYTPNDRTWEQRIFKMPPTWLLHFTKTTPISQIQIQVLRLVELVIGKGDNVMTTCWCLSQTVNHYNNIFNI